MKVNWRDVLGISLGVAGAVWPGVRVVEGLARSLPGLSGPAKQQAVLDMVKESLMLGENIADKDLLDDPAVEQATRGVIDAVVGFHNVVAAAKAAKQAARAGAAPVDPAAPAGV